MQTVATYTTPGRERVLVRVRDADPPLTLLDVAVGIYAEDQHTLVIENLLHSLSEATALADDYLERAGMLQAPAERYSPWHC